MQLPPVFEEKLIEKYFGVCNPTGNLDECSEGLYMKNPP